MDLKLRQTLSPVALATALALTSVDVVLPVPWFAPGVAQASHCTPPCDCACVCDCNTCDVCGCDYTDDDDRECGNR
jgi:hypothetical protein